MNCLKELDRANCNRMGSRVRARIEIKRRKMRAGKIMTNIIEYEE